MSTVISTPGCIPVSKKPVSTSVFQFQVMMHFCSLHRLFCSVCSSAHSRLRNFCHWSWKKINYALTYLLLINSVASSRKLSFNRPKCLSNLLDQRQQKAHACVILSLVCNRPPVWIMPKEFLQIKGWMGRPAMICPLPRAWRPDLRTAATDIQRSRKCGRSMIQKSRCELTYELDFKKDDIEPKVKFNLFRIYSFSNNVLPL